MKSAVYAPVKMFAAVCVALVVVCSARVDAQDVPPAPRPWNTTSESSAPQALPNGSRLRVNPDARPDDTRPYIVDAGLRTAARSGYSISAFAGANVGSEFSGNTAGLSDRVMPMGGLKFGYTFPFDREPIDQFFDETKTGLRLAGGLEVEAFYLGNEFKTANGGKLEIDNAYFMLNALLKAKWSRFMVYGGPGVGINYADASISGGGQNRSDEKVHLAYQLIGGLDVYLDPSWSLFAEYKWLAVESPSILGVNADRLQNNTVSMGVRHHF